MATNTDGDIIIGTKLDDSEFQSGLNKMAGTAAKGAAAVAAAIGAMSVAVISLGSEFESANAKASTLFGDAQVDMTQYQGKMLELSTKTGLAASELGNTMYDALSAGIPASDDMSEAMGFLEKNTKLAKAGFTDINTATTATAKVLNAYKMDVSETDKVHKILMQTQNKGITTVNELGSVLSQVTPTASAMNVAFEQVGASLANMTAQGTPTAQATTQLNQLFAELGKSGTKGQEGMMKALEGSKYAGKGFSDLMKEGVPLNEILDLMADYASKNNLSMLDMFSSIEAGKAALAVSGQNSKQFADNLKAMGTEIDVVGEAYDKVTNTFEEKSKKAVNSLKNVGIAAYDKFKEPLSKAMDAAQKSINSLSKSLSSGKIGKSIDKIAEGFGKLIEVAIDLASKTIPILIDGFAFVVDNGNLVVGTIAAISAAMLVYNNYQTISNGVTAITTSLQTVGAAASLAYGTAHAVMAGQITLAQGAMELFNLTMLSNPIALATAAVAGLTAAIAVLAINSDFGKTKAQELMETIDQQTESLNEAHVAAKERADDAMFEINNLQMMKHELDSIVDANGNVIAGFEDRASFLVNELAQATGLDIELVNGQIKNYGELTQEIDKTIQKMKAEALLTAYKDEYTQALKDQKDAYKTLQEATEDYNKVFGESNKKMQDYIKNHTDNLIKKGLAEKEAHEQAKKEWRNTNKDVYDAFKEAEKNYNNYTTTIVNYDQAKTEALKGNFDIVEEMLDADSSAHEKNLVKKQELMESEINELIYKNESLASIRTKANAETVDAEIEHNNKMLLEKRLGLFALQNEIFAQTPQYQEAYKYLSDMGAEAFDENGNLVPAAQAKVDEAKNAVLGWAFNYGDALTELANEGEKAFDENGNLTLAAQKKILDAKVAAGEFSPQYVDALKELADNGERIYDENGNLTVAAQKKVANAYAKINEITPEYVNALKEVAVKGQLEFDKNGELTDAAKKKVDEARTKIDAEQINMIATGKSLASSSKQGFESVEFQGAGANAVLGIVDGAGNRKSVNEVGGVFTKLAKTAINSFKNFLGIKSPSRVFSNMSKWIPKGIVKGINDSSGEAVASIENLSKDLIDSFDTNQLSNALGKMDLAIANEQLRMSADSRIQAEYKVGKAVAELKQEKQPLKATLEANITVANNIDGREAGIALAPIIAEEFEFLQ